MKTLNQLTRKQQIELADRLSEKLKKNTRNKQFMQRIIYIMYEIPVLPIKVKYMLAKLSLSIILKELKPTAQIIDFNAYKVRRG